MSYILCYIAMGDTEIGTQAGANGAHLIGEAQCLGNGGGCGAHRLHRGQAGQR